VNDQNNHHDPYYQPQPQIVGYDEYGQPVYQQGAADQQQPGAGRAPVDGRQEYGYGYDPYAQAQQYPEPEQYPQARQYPGNQQYTEGHGYPQGQAYHQDQPYQGQDQPYQGQSQPYQDQGHHQAQQPHPQQARGQEPGGQPQGGQPYGYDPYGTQRPQQHQQHEQPQQWQSSGRPSAPGQSAAHAAPQATAPQPTAQQAASAPAAGHAVAPVPVPEQRRPAPEQERPAAPEPPATGRRARGSRDERRTSGERAAGEAAEARERRPRAGEAPGAARDARNARDAGDYSTEQFAFVDEPDEESEDVIDWLKFTESRSERREEAKRRGRNRMVALVVALALALVGGVGYLWYAGLLPGLSREDGKQGGATATGPQQRDVIVLHLHNTKDQATSTALLVDNATTKQGTTVLLPNALAVTNDDGTATTLGKSVEDDGSSGTREAVGSLLGTRITGTWRLDTPYLENLVELVGGIEVTTDAEVPAAKEGEPPLVRKGEGQTLDGRAAVAYATHRGDGESEAEQLQRFGQVVHGVLRKMSDDPKSATATIQSLAQILDPSLPDKDLGASLAKLAEHAKKGAYKTAMLPVEGDGRLTEEAGRSVVQDILGGSVTAPEQGAVVRVGVRNASGDPDATEAARIVLVNGGYAVVDGGRADGTEGTSEIVYGDAARKPEADEVAKTLGLPAKAVRQGKSPANADVTVVLGKDYKAP
jgi:anionic cell wall polymer biosynthesis LytR-Cps2A-Psr (LCP) family protein